MRFLHLADLHLDTSFRGRRPEIRERLREALRQALVRAVDHALAHEVDAVLVAGDFFDGERLSFRSERFLVGALGRLVEAGIDVVYVTGNHDPGGAGGAAARIPWPEGVAVIAGPEPRTVEILRDGRVVGRVTGAGHEGPREGSDLSRAFPGPRGDVPEVGLLHTQVVGARGDSDHERYAPSELSRLRASGFAYWALGHIHVRQELSSDPPIHYAGNVQGRHPGEDGPRGGLLVELEDGRGARVRFLELASLRWETVRLESLRDASHFDALVSRVAERWSAERERDPGIPGAEWLLRVELAGESPLHRELSREENVHELEQELRGRLGLLDVEVRAHSVRPVVEVGPHRSRVDVLGESLAMMETLTAGGSASETLGLEASELAGVGDRDMDAYVRELIRGEEAFLVSALLDEGKGG